MRNWTMPEIAVLREYYPAEGTRGVQKRLRRRRSRLTIQLQAARQGISYDHPERWTADEDEELRELWDTRTADEVASYLGRTTLAVYMRVKTLGLVERKPRWSVVETALLRSQYGKATIAELAHAFERTERAIKLKAWRMGISGGGERCPSCGVFCGPRGCTKCGEAV